MLHSPEHASSFALLLFVDDDFTKRLSLGFSGSPIGPGRPIESLHLSILRQGGMGLSDLPLVGPDLVIPIVAHLDDFDRGVVSALNRNRFPGLWFVRPVRCFSICTHYVDGH